MYHGRILAKELLSMFKVSIGPKRLSRIIRKIAKVVNINGEAWIVLAT